MSCEPEKIWTRFAGYTSSFNPLVSGECLASEGDMRAIPDSVVLAFNPLVSGACLASFKTQRQRNRTA